MKGMVGGDWIGLDGRVLHLFFTCGLQWSIGSIGGLWGIRGRRGEAEMETEGNREDGDRG